MGGDRGAQGHDVRCHRGCDPDGDQYVESALAGALTKSNRSELEPDADMRRKQEERERRRCECEHSAGHRSRRAQRR
jgi:hypothetical protein